MRALLMVLLFCCSGLALAASPKTEVAVLSTLHKLHAQTPAYDFTALGRSLLKLAPDVLCIEVRPDRFEQRADESTKVEFPQVVYPLLQQHPWPVYPMEPMQPLYDRIGRAYMTSYQAFSEQQPDVAVAFSAHNTAMYALLGNYWTTPARVNDRVTDAFMRAKHQLQQDLVGAGEREGWQAWNAQFMAAIDRAVSEHPGKRIVVLAGAEHGYWLRDALAARDDLVLLDTAALLAE